MLVSKEQYLSDHHVAVPLSPTALRDIIDLSLWAGQLLLQNGANAARVEETVHRFGTGLGCNWLDIIISPTALIVTTSSGQEFRTKARRIVRFGQVNMDILTAVNDLSYRIMANEVDRYQVRRRLEQINRQPGNYHPLIIVLTVGLACAAFSKLFGGDWIVAAVTLVAAATAMQVRRMLAQRHFNLVLQVTFTALTAGLIASTATLFQWGNVPQIALVASVLLLVPGVPLVNAFHDLLSSYYLLGIARGVQGGLISFGIATGLSLAVTITRVGEIMPQLTHPPTFWEDGLWAGLAALGFAILFNLPVRTLPSAVLCGAVGHLLRYLIITNEPFGLGSIEIASLGGATAVGFLGLLLAKLHRVPRILFTVPGIIPMIPGTFAFGTMLGILQAANIDTTAVAATAADQILTITSVNAIKTGLILAMLAIGTLFPTFIFERRKPVV